MINYPNGLHNYTQEQNMNFVQYFPAAAQKVPNLKCSSMIPLQLTSTIYFWVLFFCIKEQLI